MIKFVLSNERTIFEHKENGEIFGKERDYRFEVTKTNEISFFFLQMNNFENSSPEVSPIGLEILQVADKLIEKVYKKLNKNEWMKVL